MRTVEDIMNEHAIAAEEDDKYFVFKNGNDAYEIGSITKTMKKIEFNMIDWGIDESMTLIDKVFDRIYECDGGCGGGCGGGCSCGGDGAGAGGGIASGDVLGPGGNFENGGGCMGKDDFHVPFPVMPCLFRWPNNWIGGSKKKRKRGKKTVSTKNPYVKGMKTIIAEEDENVVKYVGPAKEEFDKVVGQSSYAYTDVLNYNHTWNVAWLIKPNGVLCLYKPMKIGQVYTVYASHLLEDGRIMLDYKGGKYPTEEQAYDAIYKAAQDHKKKLQECLRKLNEARPDMHKFIRLTARGVEPTQAWRQASAEPDIDGKQLADEAKRRFPHQFDELRLDNSIGRWTAEFKLPLPDGQQ